MSDRRRSRRATALALAAPAPARAPVRLEEAAPQVLRQNWTGRSTVPAPGLYPHQWSWDTAFVAIGRRHLSPQRAQQVGLPVRRPVGRRAGAPHRLPAVGAAQPVLSRPRVLALVHCGGGGRGPHLTRWHAYLYDHRDLGGDGLVAIVHPWESGMDNSPCWDEPLSRVPVVAPAAYHRADLDHSAPAERPADRDYARYIRLAAHYRDREYRDEDDGDHGPHPFAVEDPGCNALLAASETALADIAAAVGADPAPHRRRAEHVVRAMLDGLWSPEAGLFRCRDVRTGRPERQSCVQGLVPLVVSGLPATWPTRSWLRPPDRTSAWARPPGWCRATT